jgi:hypothetical protein
LTAGLLAAPSGAGAQPPAPSDQLVADIAALARAALTMARLEDGSPVPAETPEELAVPIIPREAEIMVIRRGALSARMQHCRLDWQTESYMQHLRARGWAGKTMAYVGLLHGMSQGLALRGFAGSADPCRTDEIKALRTEAASLPSDE